MPNVIIKTKHNQREFINPIFDRCVNLRMSYFSYLLKGNSERQQNTVTNIRSQLINRILFQTID